MSTQQLAQKWNINKWEIIILLWILFYAFQMTYLCGQRGFFIFDQSIIFDGSYRIASGQIPFKDFLIPFGPMVFWLQGFIFKITGVNYASYIFGAALFNVGATAVCYLILRLLFRQQWLPALFGSLFTGIWFYPPFGTPWPEQTAFFFSLVSILIILVGFKLKHTTIKGERTLYLIAGLFAFMAVISKQNAGAFIVPVAAVLFWAASPRDFRQIVIDFVLYSLGWVAGLLAFGMWLFARSDFSLFMRHFIEIPANEVSADRLSYSVVDWIKSIFVGSAPMVITIVSLISVLIAIFYIILNLKMKSESNSVLLPAIMSLSLFLYHNIFRITSNNQIENSLPFIGLIAATGLGLLLRAKKFNSLRIIAAIIFVGISIWSLWLGANVAYSRQVHNIFQQSTFPHRLENQKLSALSWGEPTRIKNRIPPGDINRILEYLKQSGENFFIFPDFTLFYGILDVPSPQPLVWFHPGLTYSRKYDSSLDNWLVADLQKNDVRIIIIEQESWFNTTERLADFPLLKTFIADHFEIEKQIGNFIIYVYQDQ